MHIEQLTILQVKLNFKGRESLEYLKELREYLYVLLSKLKTTETVSTPITNREGTTIKNSEKS